MEISWSALWRITIFVLILFFLFLIRDILAVIALALVVAVICRPAVDFLQKKKVARVLGTSFIFLLLFSAAGFFIWLAAPLFFSQLNNFLLNFNENIGRVIGENALSGLNEWFFLNGKTFLNVFSGGAFQVSHFIFSVFGGVFAVLTGAVLAFYFTLEEKGAEDFFCFFLPQKYEARIIAIFRNSSRRINRWFQGRILLSLFVGLLSWAGLALLRVDYSFTLALLAGVLDILPFIGPLIVGVLAFMIGLNVSWLLGIWAALFFLIVQQLESVIFTPWIMKKTTGLSPLVVLLALLIGAKLAGLLGFILAIPTAMVMQETFREFERRETI